MRRRRKRARLCVHPQMSQMDADGSSEIRTRCGNELPGEFLFDRAKDNCRLTLTAHSASRAPRVRAIDNCPQADTMTIMPARRVANSLTGL